MMLTKGEQASVLPLDHPYQSTANTVYMRIISGLIILLKGGVLMKGVIFEFDNDTGQPQLAVPVHMSERDDCVIELAKLKAWMQKCGWRDRFMLCAAAFFASSARKCIHNAFEKRSLQNKKS